MREYLKSRAAKDDSGFEAEHIRVSMTALAGTPSRRFHAPALKAVPLGSYCKQIPWPLPNVWLGVTAESQETADARIPDLLATPAAVRFVSVEPMLSKIDLGPYLSPHFQSETVEYPKLGELNLVISGGESGPHARPSHPDWFRSLRDQCAVAGVAYLHKQNGEWVSVLDRDKEDPDWRYDYSAAVRDRSRCFLNLAGGCGFHGEKLHVMRRIGKRRAGRLLDGVEHSAFPATQLKEE
jgi:protein gp37